MSSHSCSAETRPAPTPAVNPHDRQDPRPATLERLARNYDAIILAVAHRDFIALGPAALRALGKAKCVVYDVKAALPADQVDGRL
jgi:UDP-N-acetyl-D-mannosaminuronate dehydrogenase